MHLKQKYAEKHKQLSPDSLDLNRRLFNTYDRIGKRISGKSLHGTNVDLGGGDKGFTVYCESIGIASFPYDYPEFDLEHHELSHEDGRIDFITMNAVLEHVGNPEHILLEIMRVLKKNGLLFIRTPNWKMD